MTTSYLLSFLRQKYAGRKAEAFVREMPGHWLVWEPGHWRPPRQVGETIVAPLAELEKSDGEALAMALPPPKLGQSSVTVGRDDDNSIAIHDATVSRVHFQLSPNVNGSWTIRDGGSSNGTWVEGARIEGLHAANLASGKVIRAGSVLLTFYDSAGLFRRIQGK